MTNQSSTILAAVSVFEELLDNGSHDIYTVIGLFVEGAIGIKKKYSFSSSDIHFWLLEEFGISIPEPVVKTTLKQRLEKHNKVRAIGNHWNANPDLVIASGIIEEIRSQEAEIQKLTDSVIEYANSNSYEAKIDPKELKEEVLQFVRGSKATKHCQLISRYVLSLTPESAFKLVIDSIKKGILICDGIKHTPNLDSATGWDGNLTLYLDTEILFNAGKLNGEVFYEIFKDFHDQYKEINAASKRRGASTGSIFLRYFSEAEEEINQYFRSAVKIIETSSSPANPKAAMMNILEGCRVPSDVIRKKTEFFKKLEFMGIIRASQESETIDQRFTHTTEDNIKFSMRENPGADEQEIYSILQTLSKINSIRCGNNDMRTRNSTAYFVSGRRYVYDISTSKYIQSSESGLRLTASLGTWTSRLWFQLNKGILRDAPSLKSMDITIRARIILSNHVKDTVFDRYRRLEEEVKQGKISQKDLTALYSNLRAVPLTPDSLTLDEFENSIRAVSNSEIEAHQRLNAMQTSKIAEGTRAVNTLFDLFEEEFNSLKRIERHKSRVIFYLWGLKKFAIPFAITLGSIGVVFYVHNKQADLSTYILDAIGFTSASVGWIREWGKIKGKIVYAKNKSHSFYRRKLTILISELEKKYNLSRRK